MFQSEDTGWQNGLKKKKKLLSICCLYEIDFKPKDIADWKWTMKQINYKNGNEKKRKLG